MFSCGNGRKVPATSCARLPPFFVIWSEPLLQRKLGVLMGKRLTPSLITIHEWLQWRIRCKSVRTKTDPKDIVVKPHHWWSWNIIIWRWCWQSGTHNCQQQETWSPESPKDIEVQLVPNVFGGLCAVLPQKNTLATLLMYWSSIWQPWHLMSIVHRKSACHVWVLEILDSGRKVLGEVYVGSSHHPSIVDKQSIHCYERANTNLHFPLLQERVFTQSVCF